MHLHSELHQHLSGNSTVPAIEDHEATTPRTREAQHCNASEHHTAKVVQTGK